MELRPVKTARPDSDDTAVDELASSEILQLRSHRKASSKDSNYNARRIQHEHHEEIGTQLAYAKSQTRGFEPPLSPKEEGEVVQLLLLESGLQQMSVPGKRIFKPSVTNPDFNETEAEFIEFIEFELSEFTVYLPDNRAHPWEMRGLDHLATRLSHSTLVSASSELVIEAPDCGTRDKRVLFFFLASKLPQIPKKLTVDFQLFDGILSAKNARYYVQAIPFQVCSVGNYGNDYHNVGSDIWIKSDQNSKSDIFYRLGSPSPEYQRFHDGFLWIANLGKHFVDYCQAFSSDVSIRDFKSKFSQSVKEIHWESEEFQDWYKKFGKDDFRIAITMNINYLYKEAIGINENFAAMPIWGELLENDIIPQQEIIEQKTVVTPYIYESFKEMKFGHILKPVNPSRVSGIRARLQGGMLRLTDMEDLELGNHDPGSRPPIPEFPYTSSPPKIGTKTNTQILHSLPSQNKPFLGTIKPGDVLSVMKDGKGAIWKDEVSRWKAVGHCWYLYVQRVHISKAGQKSFIGIWLYQSSDTSCAKMKYLFPNELFFSDNCNCRDNKVEEDELLGVVHVTWNGSPSIKGLFVRQTYLENERFVTFQEKHKMCEHSQTPESKLKADFRYPVGQTVLALATITSNKKRTLEVYEIVEYVSVDGFDTNVVLRHLMKRMGMDGTAGCRPNELVYTSTMVKLDIKKISAKCLVRFFTGADVSSGLIPAPYSRDGTGNAFFITSRLVENKSRIVLEPIEDNMPRSLIQGFDPTASPPRQQLRGLDLFCGGGNFGRGLEEGGAIKNEWAVDINKRAIHTYYANLEHPNDTKLYWGSVNDVLKEALQGNPKQSTLIPLPGDVDFISGGSPCQGFSHINSYKQTEKGLKDQSMVASVASYIDFYRPKYGVLENVLGMAQSGKGRDEDVLSQLICAIVGLGYQLQILLLDAWSFGSAQSRSRLFVCFTAPSLEPMSHPSLSHAHPTDVTTRGLGKLANGESFGHRRICSTAFPFPSAKQATADLPPIRDGATLHCTSHPDHVVPSGHSQMLRDQLQLIPKHPRGMTLRKAFNDGKGSISEEQYQKHWGHLIYNRKGHVRETFTATSSAYGRIDPARYFHSILGQSSPMDARHGRCIHWDEDRLMTILEAKRAQGYPDNEVLVGLMTECWKILGNSVPRTISMALGLSIREAWLESDVDNLFPPKAARMDQDIAEALLESPQSSPALSRNGTGGFTESKPGVRLRKVSQSVEDSELFAFPSDTESNFQVPIVTPRKTAIVPIKVKSGKAHTKVISQSTADSSRSTTPKTPKSRTTMTSRRATNASDSLGRGHLMELSDSSSGPSSSDVFTSQPSSHQAGRRKRLRAKASSGLKQVKNNRKTSSSAETNSSELLAEYHKQTLSATLARRGLEIPDSEASASESDVLSKATIQSITSSAIRESRTLPPTPSYNSLKRTLSRSEDAAMSSSEKRMRVVIPSFSPEAKKHVNKKAHSKPRAEDTFWVLEESTE